MGVCPPPKSASHWRARAIRPYIHLNVSKHGLCPFEPGSLLPVPTLVLNDYQKGETPGRKRGETLPRLNYYFKGQKEMFFAPIAGGWDLRQRSLVVSSWSALSFQIILPLRTRLHNLRPEAEVRSSELEAKAEDLKHRPCLRNPNTLRHASTRSASCSHADGKHSRWLVLPGTTPAAVRVAWHWITPGSNRKRLPLAFCAASVGSVRLGYLVILSRFPTVIGTGTDSTPLRDARTSVLSSIWRGARIDVSELSTQNFLSPPWIAHLRTPPTLYLHSFVATCPTSRATFV